MVKLGPRGAGKERTCMRCHLTWEDLGSRKIPTLSLTLLKGLFGSFIALWIFFPPPFPAPNHHGVVAWYVLFPWQCMIGQGCREGALSYVEVGSRARPDIRMPMPSAREQFVSHPAFRCYHYPTRSRRSARLLGIQSPATPSALYVWFRAREGGSVYPCPFIVPFYFFW